MTWDPNAEYKPEVQKCRHRLANYCQGAGLDIGCGPEKIIPRAIGIDSQGGDINCDISRGLDIFQENFFDYVFSSHCLEDFINTGPILQDWWSKIKTGGYLILYLPHRDHYPNIGQPGANTAHQHDFISEDIIKLMDDFATYELLENAVHSEADEYSFELVFKKLSSHKMPAWQRRQRDRRPSCLIIRYGAFGDQLITSPLVKRIHEDGYRIVYNCTDRALPVVRNNPYIDEIIVQGQDLIPNQQLEAYWDHISKGYDKVVNLSESLEVKFLKVHTKPEEYNWPIEKRREICGAGNYYDYALERGGYTDVKSPRPELYPTPIEDGMGAFFRKRYEDKFIVLWCLQGSSMHKCYPFGQDVALEFLRRHPDAMTITVGDDLCRLIEWDHERALKKSAVWDIRSTLLITKWVDLVISPETGVLNASGCYKTPKIGFLTHSNKTNLTKYFSNDLSIQADIECSPCHRMIYVENARTDCPKMDLGEGAWLCACAGAFDPREIIRRMEKVYEAWKNKKEGNSRLVSLIRPEQAVRDWNRLRAGNLANAKQPTLRSVTAPRP